MKTKYQHGFTLYELLVTMLIVGIVLTIGVPNMSEFTANSRMATTANDLHASFMLARSEAARSKSNITICASANSLDPAATCNGAFDDGWIALRAPVCQLEPRRNRSGTRTGQWPEWRPRWANASRASWAGRAGPGCRFVRG